MREVAACEVDQFITYELSDYGAMYLKRFCQNITKYFTIWRSFVLDEEGHMFALHFVFLPGLQRDLKFFRNAHNNHGIRTENYQTPLQLWMLNVLIQKDSNSSALTLILPCYFTP